MSILWTSREAAEATGGMLTGPAWEAQSVSIDTRSIEPGALFVALKDVRDGHDFVADALEKGAVAALVSRVPHEVPADAPLLLVHDVLNGLEEMAQHARARTGARVIAVTGSVGKTSTKEMLRAALSGQGEVHAAERSFNNHWGVPLTLARMPANANFAVIEIGMNHPGEIAPLARLARPHVAVVTTVAAAHLEAFANIEGIAREKASIMEGLEPGGTAVLNVDLATSPILLSAVPDRAERCLFGLTEDADWRATSVEIAEDATIVELDAAGETVIFKLATPGRHFALNGVAALAAAEAAGADLARACIALSHWTAFEGRGTRETVVFDTGTRTGVFTLVDDAYNANPTSLTASLEVLAASKPRDADGGETPGRRIAILGDMLELGEDAANIHALIARQPTLKDVDIVHCAGPLMHNLWTALPPHRRGEWCETAQELAERVRRLVGPGDVVLVKGSLGSRVSLCVDALRKLGQST